MIFEGLNYVALANLIFYHLLDTLRPEVPISKVYRDAAEGAGPRENHKCMPQLKNSAISLVQPLFPAGIQSQYCELFLIFKRIRKSRYFL